MQWRVVARIVLFGLVPMILSAGIGWGLAVQPMLERQGLELEIHRAAAEIRSTSRALQRDVLLLVFDPGTEEKTLARVRGRVPQFRDAASHLGTVVSRLDPEKGHRLEMLHHSLADGILAVADVVAAGGRGGAWAVQQERVLANEIPAARTNDPVIEEFAVRIAGHGPEMRWRLALVLLCVVGAGMIGTAIGTRTRMTA